MPFVDIRCLGMGDSPRQLWQGFDGVWNGRVDGVFGEAEEDGVHQGP